MTFLLVVKMTEQEDATAKLTKCLEISRQHLEDLPLRFLGICFLTCCQPQSEGINQLCAFLQDIPVPEFRAAHTRYSLTWVLSQIRSSITAQAVQLQDVSAWIKGNEDNLPQMLPTPEEVCLTAAGHALYLPNRDEPPPPQELWLVLDLPSILHDVYGTLFSQYREIVNEFGLLHCCHLAALFPHLDLQMVQQHCCSIWWNGITWMSIAGVDVTVQITDNRVIHVIGTSLTTDKLCQYLTDVISDILSTVLRLSPKLEAAAYIVHPPKVAMSSADITATQFKLGGPQSLNYFKAVHRLWRTLRGSSGHSLHRSSPSIMVRCLPQRPKLF